MIKTCPKHGETDFAPRMIKGEQHGWRCRACLSAAVVEHRRRTRKTLVDEAGGKCILCGYDRYIGALHFHHLDPKTKEFGLSERGLTKKLTVLREEAAKCVLLCVRCHLEVENGLVSLTG